MGQNEGCHIWWKLSEHPLRVTPPYPQWYGRHIVVHPPAQPRSAVGHDQVTRHLTSRFQPSPTLIKQRIEKLIEREPGSSMGSVTLEQPTGKKDEDGDGDEDDERERERRREVET